VSVRAPVPPMTPGRAGETNSPEQDWKGAIRLRSNIMLAAGPNICDGEDCWVERAPLSATWAGTMRRETTLSAGQAAPVDQQDCEEKSHGLEAPS